MAHTKNEDAGISMGAIAAGRDGELQTLRMVFHIELGIAHEAVWEKGAVRSYGRKAGITTGQVFDAVLSVLNGRNLVKTPLRDDISGILRLDNYRRNIHATDSTVHGVYNNEIRISIGRAHWNCLVLDIVQKARSPLLSPDLWIHESRTLGAFTQAVLVDTAFDYFQNHTFLSFHREHGRDISRLSALPDNPDRVDISRNPGRRSAGYGYQEVAGAEMWLGERFWDIAGTEAKERLLSGTWPEAEMHDNILHLKAAPECFTDATAPDVMERLRELVYGEAGRAGQARFDALNASMDSRTDAMRKRFQKARELADRDEAAFTAGNGDKAAIPPKPPCNPEIPHSNFGCKTAWLAVRSTDAAEVARALGLREARWLPWPPAISRAVNGECVGVTPAVDGWVLVVGMQLFDWLEDSAVVAAVSRRFGEAQFYLSERISDSYHWSRWMDGGPLRSVSMLDGEMTEIGERSGIEKDILAPLYLDNDWVPINEDDVLRVAGEWSVDPASLERRELEESHVLVGVLPSV